MYMLETDLEYVVINDVFIHMATAPILFTPLYGWVDSVPGGESDK